MYSEVFDLIRVYMRLRVVNGSELNNIDDVLTVLSI